MPDPLSDERDTDALLRSAVPPARVPPMTPEQIEQQRAGVNPLINLAREYFMPAQSLRNPDTPEARAAYAQALTQAHAAGGGKVPPMPGSEMFTPGQGMAMDLLSNIGPKALAAMKVLSPAAKAVGGFAHAIDPLGPGMMKELPQTMTPAFKKWFGASKLVTDKGEPLVLYHGTGDAIHEFDLEHPNRQDAGWLGTGVYMTTNPNLASDYSTLKKQGSGVGPNVMPLFAKLENPYHASQADKQRIMLIQHNKGREAARAAADEWTAKLKAQGHDGVILDYKPEDVGAATAGREVVVFDPAQVKSATGNRGTFDVNDPRLAYGLAAAATGAAGANKSDEQ